jgi:ABC-2 type transport system permease protein
VASRAPWLIVARRELLARVRTGWFIAVTLLGPVGMVGIILILAHLAMESAKEPARVEMIDRSGQELGPVIALRATANDPRLTIVAVPPDTPPAALMDKIRTSQIEGYLVVPPDVVDGGTVEYRGANAIDGALMRALEDAVNGAVWGVRARRAQLTEAELDRLVAPVGFDSQHTTGEATAASSEGTFAVGYGVMFVLYMGILLYAINVMRSVIEEKSSRIVEIMVSTIKPSQLMFGKVIGVGAVGVLQIGAWLGMAAVIFEYRGTILGWINPALGMVAGAMDLPSLGAVPIIVVLAYFLLGYFFYASLYAAVGAMVNSEQEAQQLQTPIVMLLIIPAACVQLVANNPRGANAELFTMIPFSSPILMPMRYLLGGASALDLAVSLAILAGSLAAVVWLAARIYRVGILMYGKRPSMRELARWVRY